MSGAGAGPIKLEKCESPPVKTVRRVSSEGSANDQYLQRVLTLVNNLVTIVYLLICLLRLDTEESILSC